MLTCCSKWLFTSSNLACSSLFAFQGSMANKNRLTANDYTNLIFNLNFIDLQFTDGSVFLQNLFLQMVLLLIANFKTLLL